MRAFRSSGAAAAASIFRGLRSVGCVLCLVLLIAPGVAYAAQAVYRTVLPNGLTVLVKPEPGSGIVAVDAFVRAGQAQERAPLAGIGNLVARTLMTGTLNNSAERLANAIDEVGGNFRTVWNSDFTELRAITTTDNFEEAARLIGEILSNATFAPDVVEQARKAVLEEIRSSGDDPFETAYGALLEILYKDNPYKRASVGYASAVRKLTREDALVFYHGYFVPNNTVLAIVGDVTPEKAEEAARIGFSGARESPLPKHVKIVDETLDATKSRVLLRAISSAYVLVGYLAPSLNNPDYVPFSVASSLLGGGKASRVFTRIRDQFGIGYDIGALYPWRAHQSHIALYISVDARRFDTAQSFGGPTIDDLKKLLVDQVQAVKDGDFTAEELERAKNYTAGKWLLQHQRVSDRAFFLGAMEAIGVGFEFDAEYPAKVAKVTRADVQRVVGKYLNEYAVVVLMPDSDERAEGSKE